MHLSGERREAGRLPRHGSSLKGHARQGFGEDKLIVSLRGNHFLHLPSMSSSESDFLSVGLQILASALTGSAGAIVLGETEYVILLFGTDQNATSPSKARGQSLLLTRRPKLQLSFLVFPGKGGGGAQADQWEELIFKGFQGHWNSLTSSVETLKSAKGWVKIGGQ